MRLPASTATGPLQIAAAATLGALAVLVGCLVLAGPVACVPPDEEPEARAPAETVVTRLRLAGTPLDEPMAKPRLGLRETSGRQFDFSAETDGYLTLLFFGYTSCPDICPVHLANLAAVLRSDDELRRRVKVVFVGVDPPRDTADRMDEFLAHFRADFIGLVGTPEELAAAQEAAGVPPAVVDSEWEGGYSVSHAGWILLFTPDGLGRLRYPFGVRQRQWAHDLAVLVRDGWPDA